MSEIWKWVPGYKGYYKVSDQGRVKSVDRVVMAVDGRAMQYRGKLLTPSQGNGQGAYLAVNLRKNQTRKVICVHQLVLLAFVGPPPPGMESCHDNGIDSDCRLSNLRYDTPKNNSYDRTRHGTQARGETAGNVKLTDVQVRDIKRLLRQGVKQKYIAQTYNVSNSLINQIAKNRIWTHIT